MATFVHKPKNFGWLRDRPDFRDQKYGEKKLSNEKVKVLPKKLDLRGKNMPQVYNQGETSSCTANALATILQYDRRVRGWKDMNPSRLFIYYNERFLEDSVEMDNGAMLRDGIKTLAADGYVPEELWPFFEHSVTVKPPRELYTKAKSNRIAKYYRLNHTNLNEIKTCLVNNHLVVFGYTIYNSFYDADKNGGFVPIPQEFNDEAIGGHAVLLVGYDDETKNFIMRNSWGTECGDKGYYYMKYDHITNPDLCSDFWTIRISDTDPKND